jgi:uncharacterized protein YqgV (UPF0045/DUF77 family)
VKASAQVSLYPLRRERLTPAIEAFLKVLEHEKLEAHVGPMSTLVTGDSGRVFAALREGFEQAARLGPIVMTVTVSNTCPADER